MANYLDRSKALLGEEKIKSFEDKRILIFGLGGVGGTAFNALVRSGFKHFVIVDKDVVDETNLNRQILFTKKDVGRDKVIVAKEFAKSIDESIEVEAHKVFVDNATLFDFDFSKFDFVIDAIDYIPAKVCIAKYALTNKVPFIMSLGMGNRINPEDITITNLNKTENDPLAKKLRYECRQADISLKDIPVIFSKENPLVKEPKPSSMIMVPSTAGLLIAKYVIEKI